MKNKVKFLFSSFILLQQPMNVVALPFLNKSLTTQENFFKGIESINPEMVQNALESDANPNKINPSSEKAPLIEVLEKLQSYSKSLSQKSWILTGIGTAIGLFVAFKSKKQTSEKYSDDYASSDEPISYKTHALAYDDNTLHISSNVAQFVFGGLLSAGFGYLTYKLFTRLERAKKVAQILLSNPKIQINKQAKELLKKLSMLGLEVPEQTASNAESILIEELNEETEFEYNE